MLLLTDDCQQHEPCTLLIHTFDVCRVGVLLWTHRGSTSMACGAYACSTCPAVSLRQAALLWPEASSSAQILQDNASTVDCVTLLHHVLHAHLMQSMYKSRHGVAHVTEQLHCSVAAWLSAESRGRHHNVSRVHSSQQHCTWHHCVYTVHANAAHFTSTVAMASSLL